MDDDHIVLRAYGGYKTSTKRRAGQTFASWCANNAAACIVPLALDPDIVTWIARVMQSNGAMQGIENITTLERHLKLRRTQLLVPHRNRMGESDADGARYLPHIEEGSVP